MRQKIVALFLILMALYSTGAAVGYPRPQYNPSVQKRAWVNGSTIYHPDEFAYVGITYRMLHTESWNPHYYHNPPLNIYTNLALFWLTGAQNLPFHAEYSDREIAPYQLYVLARFMSALYSLLTVALVYATGRLAFGRKTGLIAAALIGLSPLTVQHAHYATPNAETNMLAAAVLWISVRILKNHFPLPLTVTYAAGGLLAGLTGAARYNASVVAMVFGLAMLTAWWKHRRLFPVLLGGLMIPVGFVLGVPGIILEPREVVDQVQQIMDWYQKNGGGPGFTADTAWSAIYYHWRYTVLAAIGPMAAVLAAVGWAVMFSSDTWQERWIAAVLGLLLVVYTIMALRGARLQANLLFPLMIPLTLFAAYGMVWVSRNIRIGQRVLPGLVLVWPMLLSLLFAYRITAKDNRMEAQEWVYAHIPRGSSIYLLGPYNVPIDPLDYQTRQTYGGEATAEQIAQAGESIIIYSDAFPMSALRDPSLAKLNDVTRERTIQELLNRQWVELARFKRWDWPLEKITPDDVSYWHHPEIVIYCNPANCPAK